MKKRKYVYNASFDKIKAIIEDTTYGIYPPPLDAQTALNILCDYLLGDDWYFAGSCGVEQCNAVIVEHILDKYSKQWKKDWKNYKKGA